MEKVFSLILAVMLFCPTAFADDELEPPKNMKLIKQNAWKMSQTKPKRNFNLYQKKEGVEIPYPTPQQVQLDAQEAETF